MSGTNVRGWEGGRVWLSECNVRKSEERLKSEEEEVEQVKGLSEIGRTKRKREKKKAMQKVN